MLPDAIVRTWSVMCSAEAGDVLVPDIEAVRAQLVDRASVVLAEMADTDIKHGVRCVMSARSLKPALSIRTYAHRHRARLASRSGTWLKAVTVRNARRRRADWQVLVAPAG